jgi:hypothetical protein
MDRNRAEVRKRGRTSNSGRASEDGLRSPRGSGALTYCRNRQSKLRAELLEARQKDVLLIPRKWYPEDMPIDSTQGWWYAPAEAIIGRLCKRCNTFCEQAGFTSKEWSMVNKASCRKCQPEKRKCTTRNDAKRRKISAKHRSGDEKVPLLIQQVNRYGGLSAFDVWLGTHLRRVATIVATAKDRRGN